MGTTRRGGAVGTPLLRGAGERGRGPREGARVRKLQAEAARAREYVEASVREWREEDEGRESSEREERG